MSNAKAKTIKLLLNDGTLNGVISIQDSSWYAGELYSSPRESVDNLLKQDACSYFGVYLLLSEDKVYIGQASDLSKRIKQHKIGKDWWERAVLLTTTDNHFTHTDIDYLESMLIKKADELETLESDNKNKGNQPKVSKYDETTLAQYLEEALFLLELIGVNVFKNNTKKNKKHKKTEKENNAIIKTVVNSPSEVIENRTKTEVIEIFKQSKQDILENNNYAKRQETKNTYWINPKISQLNKDWDLMLNNQFDKELILIRVPAKTFKISKNGKKGLFTRISKPDFIDLNIIHDSFIDKRSKCDFSKFIIKRIKY